MVFASTKLLHLQMLLQKLQCSLLNDKHKVRNFAKHAVKITM